MSMVSLLYLPMPDAKEYEAFADDASIEESGSGCSALLALQAIILSMPRNQLATLLLYLIGSMNRSSSRTSDWTMFE